MNFFNNFHPAVIVLYFMAVLAISIIIFDPVLTGIFLVSQMLLYLLLKGGADGYQFIGKCLCLILVCGGINGLVNHRGISVLFYLGGLPVTGECLFYGCMTGALLAASLLLFGCYNHIMTSEKIMSLFGNRLPHFSLVFSMALRLIPKVKRDYERIRETRSRQTGILTALVGLSLEDSLETGVVMGYRGYGKYPEVKRTSIYSRKMRGRDWGLMAVIVMTAMTGIVLYVLSGTDVLYFPYVDYKMDFRGIAAYLCFGVLFLLPVLINITEELRWKAIVSKI